MHKAVKYLSFVGVVFGIVTIISGGSVLLGSNPGYVVFLPLVIFNTTMGFAYIVPWILTRKNPLYSKTIAGYIFLLNSVSLISIVYLYLGGTDIAHKSLGAMSFRTIVWLIIYLGLAKMISKQSHK